MTLDGIADHVGGRRRPCGPLGMVVGECLAVKFGKFCEAPFMLISVKAVRDSDGEVLGASAFIAGDRPMGRQALADLMEHVYASAADPLNPPPFTFKFEKGD